MNYFQSHSDPLMQIYDPTSRLLVMKYTLSWLLAYAAYVKWSTTA